MLTWLGIPLLVIGSMVGIGGLGLLAFGSPTQLYSATFGVAAALGLVTSRNVVWQAGWQRHGLRWPYLLALVAAGVALDGQELPSWLAVTLGVPCLLLLVRTLRKLPTLDADGGCAETRDLIST
ncbi:hypothetical protein [Crossiella cryophila]|uniref:Uncharacterized protein n=1 Tax=Crossiella cryophila TaxID=43355 RepID=A0A7W7CMU1_9PSEU|nr:hypothetical protein [Crossiella cryophila]MBB4682339.1 hypothetical protein [Crossiella cryophila]